jgi:uncharacterized protein (TIGR03663 family)
MSKKSLNHKEKTSHLWWSVLFTSIFVVASWALRFYLLRNKPVHFDESINMWFVQRIWEDGFFRYDPTNYHGPLLFYLIHAVQLFTGDDFISTRVVASLFSVATLWLLWWGPQKDRAAFRWAAVFLLLSPAMGFYGRSGIHESAFVCFQILTFVSFHWLVSKRYSQFWYTFTAGVFGMMALKETFVILVLALIPSAAALLWSLRNKWNWQTEFAALLTSLKSRSVSLAVAMIALFFVGLYSGFGANPKGLADFFIALMPWLKTGVQGNGHEKEFLHWTKFMAKYEFVILVGFVVALIVGALDRFSVKSRWIFFYGLVAFFNWLIYSLIPYKTPWCLISVLWPFAIVAGFGLEELSERWGKKKWPAATVMTMLGLLALPQEKIAYDIQFRDPIEMDHPYVYVNSTYEFKDFVDQFLGLAKEDPLLRERPVQIATGESWPLPILLSSFAVLNYQKVQTEVATNAALYFIDDSDETFMDQALASLGRRSAYKKFTLSVRQGRADVIVYLDKELWARRPKWNLKPKESL